MPVRTIGSIQTFRAENFFRTSDFGKISLPNRQKKLMTFFGFSLNISFVYYPLFIHSFITEIYIAPLQGYYSEAIPTPCTAKEKSFEAKVKCVRKNPGEQSLRQWKPIPHRGANHRLFILHFLFLLQDRCRYANNFFSCEKGAGTVTKKPWFSPAHTFEQCILDAY